jgi:hypothetical protein
MRKFAISVGGKVSTLLERMNPGGWKTEIAPFEGGELGVAYAPSPEVASHPLLSQSIIRLDNGDLIVWSGLPLGADRADVCRRAADIHDLARRLDGAFAAVGWSAGERCLYLASDFLGLQPIYIGESGGIWQAASETKAFAYVPDPAGWGAFLRCSHPIGRASLTHNAERVEAGTNIRVELAEGGRLSRERYWQWPAESRIPSHDALLAALEANVAAYHSVAPQAVCLLSGGFDSRLIVGLLRRQGIATRGLIVSHADENGNQDAKLAQKVAACAGIAAEMRHPDPDFFSSRRYLDYVWAIDGATSNLYLFIAQIQQFLDGAPVWEGLIPAHTLRTVHQPADGGFAAFRGLECAPENERWKIFRPAFRKEMAEAFEAEFARTRAQHPDDSFGMWQWIVENRMRNRTGVNPLKVYANRALPLLAGSSQSFWRAVATLPYEVRQDYRYYLDFFVSVFGDLANIPFDSGGELYGSWRSQPRLAYYRLRSRCYHELNRRPRLKQLLGRGMHGFKPSRFLQARPLWEEEDDHLDMDFVRAAARDAARARKIAPILFHWRTARWVHENRLYAVLHDTSASGKQL